MLAKTSYLFLDKPIKGDDYVIGLPAQASSGDIYHVLAYLALAEHHGAKLPSVRILWDKEDIEAHAQRGLNLASLLGFNDVQIQKKTATSQWQNAREKALRELYGNANLINQKATTLLITKHVADYGRKVTVDIIRRRFLSALRSHQPNFQPLIEMQRLAILRVYEQFCAQRHCHGLVLINKRFSTGANKQQNGGEESIWRTVENELTKANVFYWYLDTSEASSLEQRTTHLFGDKRIVPELQKAYHLCLLDALLDLPDLIGIIGNTSGTLDCAAFMGSNILDIHSFSNVAPENLFSDQEYRILSQYSWMSIIAADANATANLANQLAIWLRHKGAIKLFAPSENQLKGLQHKPSDSNKQSYHLNERIDFAGYIAEYLSAGTIYQNNPRQPDKCYLKFDDYIIRHIRFSWFLELDSRLEQQVRKLNSEPCENLKPILSWPTLTRIKEEPQDEDELAYETSYHPDATSANQEPELTNPLILQSTDAAPASIAAQTSTSLEAVTDKRAGLFRGHRNDTVARDLLTQHLQSRAKLGKALAAGDCFFDSVAQSLQGLEKRSYTAKGLRLLCHNYVVQLDKKSKADNWIYQRFLATAKSLHTKDEGEAINAAANDYHHYMANIQYMLEDIEAGDGLNITSPIWGEQDIDGRILRERLGINLHNIELHEYENRLIVGHQLNGRSVEEAAITYEDKYTVHLAVFNNHFVPILPNDFNIEQTAIKNKVIHEEPETTMNFDFSQTIPKPTTLSDCHELIKHFWKHGAHLQAELTKLKDQMATNLTNSSYQSSNVNTARSGWSLFSSGQASAASLQESANGNDEARATVDDLDGDIIMTPSL